jgi:hypothetical protein
MGDKNYGYSFGQTHLKNNDNLEDLLIDGVVERNVMN